MKKLKPMWDRITRVYPYDRKRMRLARRRFRRAIVMQLYGTIFFVAVVAVFPSFASPWDAVRGKGAPAVHEAVGFSGKSRAVFIDGEDWRGKPTRFFAWYGLPEGASAAKKCPGVVLVHGGVGTAFDRWVRMWNERGYAAIAMDTCGSVPLKDEPKSAKWKRHDWSGPEGWGGFGQVDEPPHDQWTYHAVSDIIRSHSFLRSLPEVDSARIGITGISWGGYLTCIAAGVDDRFAWAAPVYGCGFYADGSAWARKLSEMGEKGEKWLSMWDAGVYLAGARCPFLFVSGTTDNFFKVPMLKKSAAAVKGPVFYDIRETMHHSQEYGAAPESIRSFADHWSFGRPLDSVISSKWTVRKLEPAKKRAFSSIEAARNAARTMQKPAVVHLAPGVHRLEKPLVLGPEDSGVTYVADGNVVISGARPVTDWRVEADGTWSAPVPWVRSDRTGGFRSMRVNGAMRPRARLPKKGYFTIVNDDLPEGVRYDTPRPSFFYDPKEFNPDWTNLKDAEIVCYHFWVDTHLRIASVDAASNKVRFVAPARKAFDTGWTNNKSGGLRGIYTIVNLPAAMTEPGEWWLEYGTGRVHYRPMPGETPERVKAEVPFSPVLVSLVGTPEKGGRYVEDVVFRGIRFELSQFELSANDVNDAQGSATVSAAVRLVGARRCRFEGCAFENLGGYAVDILKCSRENVFSRCAMVRLGAGGIRLDGGKAGCSPVELNSGNVVEDCDIGPYGLDFRSAVGVLLKNAERTRIVHNHIHDGYYTGVSAGWVWGYYPSVSRENEISHNHIHNIGKGLLSDMGGIYTLGPSYGTRIANNRIHGINARAYGGWGIYQDEGSTGILVENNVVYDTKFAPYDIHYAKDITVRNNIFAFGKKDQIARTYREPHVSCELINNIFYWVEGNLYSGIWSDAANPFAVHRRGNDRKANETGSRVTFKADRNVYFNPELPVDKVKFGEGRSFDAWRKMGKDVHSVYADPLFKDVQRRDFRLKPESPAFKMGFVNFDQSDIGQRKAR